MVLNARMSSPCASSWPRPRWATCFHLLAQAPADLRVVVEATTGHSADASGACRTSDSSGYTRMSAPTNPAGGSLIRWTKRRRQRCPSCSIPEWSRFRGPSCRAACGGAIRVTPAAKPTAAQIIEGTAGEIRTHVPAVNSTYSDQPTKLINAENGVDYVYREMGAGKVPLVLLQHFRGSLDSWDPALIDALAVSRHVVTFDSAPRPGARRIQWNRWRTTPSAS